MKAGRFDNSPAVHLFVKRLGGVEVEEIKNRIDTSLPSCAAEIYR
jgi:hypothetical protein